MKNKFTSRGLAVLATSALLVTVAGCAPADEGAPQEDVVLQMVGADDVSAFEPLMEAFADANPGVTVEYTQIPFDQVNSVLQQRLGAKDETIDVYLVDQPRLGSLAIRGFLDDLSDLKGEAQSALTADQYEVSLWDDKLWALPIWTSTQMLYYNIDMLAEAGVKAPAIDQSQRWTWEQTLAAAKQVQDAGVVEWGLLLEQVEKYYQLQPLAESLGGGSGITGADMLEADLTNDGWVKAMNWYADSFESGIAPRGVGGFQTSLVFTDREVAFFAGGPWNVGNFEGSDVNWGVAPFPYFEGGKPVTSTGSWSLGVNPAAKHKEQALEFVKFASLSKDGNLLTVKNKLALPANSAAMDEYLPTLEARGGAGAVGLADLIRYEADNTAVPRPTSVGYIQFEDVMGKLFADIRNGSDVVTRLQQGETELETVWERLQ